MDHSYDVKVSTTPIDINRMEVEESEIGRAAFCDFLGGRKELAGVQKTLLDTVENFCGVGTTPAGSVRQAYRVVNLASCPSVHQIGTTPPNRFINP